MKILDDCAAYQCSMRPASFSEEAYQIYSRYQVAVHGDDPSKVSRKGFTQFLCSSPLEGFGHYGTFHIDYRLHGQLMAISVIDILPNCISSVYLL